MLPSFSFAQSGHTVTRSSSCAVRTVVMVTLALFGLMAEVARAQLFENLRAFTSRWPVGDPAVTNQFSTEFNDGPKGIATADLDGDTRPDLAVSDLDGTVTLYFGEEEGKFTAPVFLQTGASELRGIVCADFTGSGRPDIAVAAPYAGRIFHFRNTGGRSFADSLAIEAWKGVRSLAAGRFANDDARGLDLVAAGPDLGMRQFRWRDGDWVVAGTVPELNATNPDNFPRPFYVLKAFRPPGAERDELVATHDATDRLMVLSPDPGGTLVPRGIIVASQVHGVDIGPMIQPAATGAADLVTVHTSRGTIEIHPPVAGPERFATTAVQLLNVPGGPRAVAIADLDGDGWNDLAVVLRNFDRVLTYRNERGSLIPFAESPVGTSPRELVQADFNADGRPDLAVMNRRSQDVSVLLTFPGQAGFSQLDQVYPTDGGVAGLAVFDVNGDGRDDVIQLHRASGESSVRLALEGGRLGDPVFIPVGGRPVAFAVVDVNHDDLADIVTAGLEGGIQVALATKSGGFEDARESSPPAAQGGALFALVPADFNGDGNVDLAVGYFDCRLGFFRGDGTGRFDFIRSHYFVYEARSMVAGDFDRDGDVDLAGAGMNAELAVLENVGDWLKPTAELRRTIHPLDQPGGVALTVTDANADGDPDLAVGTPSHTVVFLGREGVRFEPQPSTPAAAASSIVNRDMDGDNVPDLVQGCALAPCVLFLKGAPNGTFTPTLSVPVPSSAFIAVGDLDGDRQIDLVGTGNVLWTVLSSRRMQVVAPAPSRGLARQPANRVVLNELLALNSSLPVPSDGNRLSDWLELFNGTSQSMDLLGWKLRLVKSVPDSSSKPEILGGARVLATNEFTFTSGAVIGAKRHLVVVCSERTRTPLHTGFALPGEGATLALLDASGVEVDHIRYRQQDEGVSFSRYRDGLPSWVLSTYPSPGRANVDNGEVEPVVKLAGISPAAPRAGEPIRFTATGRDDVGIVLLTVVCRRLDAPNEPTRRFLLFDDGMNGDGGVLDGTFSGVLDTGLPAGAEVQFYLECTDLTGETVTVPEDATFARPGEPVRLYSFAVGAPKPPLEISEVVANNSTGLQDEMGGTPDWIEIRNCSTAPVSLAGMTLAPGFFGNGSRLAFPSDLTLDPGKHLVVFCDNQPTQGPLHAPFQINRDGDAFVLASTAPNRGRVFIDSVKFGPLAANEAWARLGCGGPWRRTAPTPRTANVQSGWVAAASDDNREFTLAFPTLTGRRYTVEHTESLEAPQWIALPPITGDGLEKSISQPLTRQRFFRVR